MAVFVVSLYAQDLWKRRGVSEQYRPSEAEQQQSPQHERDAEGEETVPELWYASWHRKNLARAGVAVLLCCCHVLGTAM